VSEILATRGYESEHYLREGLICERMGISRQRMPFPPTAWEDIEDYARAIVCTVLAERSILRWKTAAGVIASVMVEGCRWGLNWRRHGCGAGLVRRLHSEIERSLISLHLHAHVRHGTAPCGRCWNTRDRY